MKNTVTKQELLKAAHGLGITGVNLNTRKDEIQSKINAVLGVPDLDTHDQDHQVEAIVATVAKHGEEAVATETGAVTAIGRNIPNLAPTGKWQGKRARLIRTKTGQNDMSGAIFNWNGWPCIIPIDVQVDIAWPIFEIIKMCRGMLLDIELRVDPQNKGRVHNIKHIKYYDKYPFQFMGVTPGTEDLPESPIEYTLDMYVEDFPGYTVRMWRQLCILWEINDEQAKIKPGIGPEKEIESRRNAIHYALNLPMETSLEIRQRVRNEKRADHSMEAKAA